MTNALIFNVHMELGLEFLAIIGLNFPKTKREHCNDFIVEVDGVGLIEQVTNLECPNARDVVDRSPANSPFRWFETSCDPPIGNAAMFRLRRGFYLGCFRFSRR